MKLNGLKLNYKFIAQAMAILKMPEQNSKMYSIDIYTDQLRNFELSVEFLKQIYI